MRILTAALQPLLVHLVQKEKTRAKSFTELPHLFQAVRVPGGFHCKGRACVKHNSLVIPFDAEPPPGQIADNFQGFYLFPSIDTTAAQPAVASGAIGCERIQGAKTNRLKPIWSTRAIDGDQEDPEAKNV